jgi:hypothetical protein
MLAKNKKAPKPKKRRTTLAEKALGSVLIAVGIVGVVISAVFLYSVPDEPFAYVLYVFITLFSLLLAATGWHFGFKMK